MPRDEGESGCCFDDIYANLQKHGLVTQPPISPGVPPIVFEKLANSAQLNDDARDVEIIISWRVRRRWTAQSLKPYYVTEPPLMYQGLATQDKQISIEMYSHKGHYT